MRISKKLGHFNFLCFLKIVFIISKQTREVKVKSKFARAFDVPDFRVFEVFPLIVLGNALNTFEIQIQCYKTTH